jgi:SAM-dependent methyltransferase
VIGIDGSPEMLERARARVPGADLRVGELAELPLESDSADLAVCALALSHLEEIGPCVAELGRVLRPGGCLILSDLHPTMLMLGGTALFFGADGAAGNVRSYHHSHADYLAAFRDSGLEVVDCAEPGIEAEDLQALSGGLMNLAEEAFRTAWVGMPNALIWKLVQRK